MLVSRYLEKIGQFNGARPCVTMMIFISKLLLIMKKYDLIYGIDVGSKDLDFFEFFSEKKKNLKNNTRPLIKWVKSLPADKKILCVLEATGAYSKRLTHYLGLNEIDTIVLNPSQSHGFALAQGIISKNDEQAAKTLALMGNCLEMPLYRHPDDNMKKRSQLLLSVNALKKQAQMLKNQLHSFSSQIIFSSSAVSALGTTLQTVENEIVKLEDELNDTTDEEHQRQFNLLNSIVGIGPKIAHSLLNATGSLLYFQQAKQLSKFIGLVPSSHISGTSVRIRGRMTKKGNTDLRAKLYMGARSAIRFNTACKALYDRLREKGKPHKKAMVAVMNKLIKQAFGVVSSGVTFDNDKYTQMQKI